MAELSNQSLDDTLKELMNEDDTSKESSQESTNTEKPKRRGRRSKAEIEAEKASVEKSNESSENLEEVDSISVSEDVKGTEESVDETSRSKDVIESEVPEVIEDTSKDIEPDVNESEVIDPELSSEEELKEKLDPEVIEDSETDLQPDVETPKKRDVTPKKASAEAKAALSGVLDDKEESGSNIIGKTILLKQRLPLYRARHLSMPVRPYMGQVKIIEDARDGFFKVEYYRPAFGACEAFMPVAYLLVNQEDKSNEEIEE